MTTERQKAANRTNSKKSTGPRSLGGKRRSSQNSRRHGLTLPPDEAHVLRWYQIITNVPCAQLEDALTSKAGSAALFLAEAEAHLERTRDAERTHLEKMIDIALKRGRRSAFELIELSIKERFEDEDFLNAMIENCFDPTTRVSEKDYLLGLLRLIKRRNPNRQAELSRQMQILRGYRKRAEGRKNLAFRAWLHACEA